jgi:hypothetical protein
LLLFHIYLFCCQEKNQHGCTIRG